MDEPSSPSQSHTSLQSIAIIVEPYVELSDTSTSDSFDSVQVKQKSYDGAVVDFILSATRSGAATAGTQVGFKILLPAKDGYIVRNDFLDKRMVGSEFVEKLQCFAVPGQRIKAPLSNRAHPQLHELLESAVGAILVSHQDGGSLSRSFTSLDRELEVRLSYPWIVPQPMARRRLVMVGQRHQEIMMRWLIVAHHLDIRLTFVGAEGHWLQSYQGFDAPESYIAMDLSNPSQRSERLVDAVTQSGNFDGICTFTDTYLVDVAKAATILGLPTAPVDSVLKCMDKHTTRSLDMTLDPPLRVKDYADLETRLSLGQLVPAYPLLAKPCSGWASQGVHKIDSQKDLHAAFKSLDTSHPDVDKSLDVYIDGPEVDANFVLQDGHLLFFELVDGFPCTAEIRTASCDPGMGNFLETDQIWPSGHPTAEIEAVRSSLQNLLKDMNLRNGIYHLECRIRNSNMHYTVENEILDLRPHGRTPAGNPTPFLLEINQRPPGNGGLQGTAHCYGIDYTALHMVAALGETERFRALSQPFRGGALHTVDSLFINADRAGVYDGEDLREILRAKRPDLLSEIPYSVTYYVKGEKIVSDPPRIALFCVMSTKGRQHVLEVADTIRRIVQPAVRVI